MIRFGLIIGIGLLAPVNDANAGCEPIAGIDSLLAPGGVLLFGELHGTVESPAFVNDVACHAAAAGLDVVVGLELSEEANGGIQAFLDSAGEPADRDALVDGRVWQRDYQDGRGSRAMVELLAALARARRKGAAVRVVLFDAQPPGGGQARERAMAGKLAATAQASPESLHVVLTGNLHSRVTRGSPWSAEYEPMGYLLGRRIGAERVTALDVSHTGGTAWVCTPECGVTELGGRGSAPRAAIALDEPTRPAGHDGWYGVGSITASPPGNGRHDEAAPLPRPLPSQGSPPREPSETSPEQTPELLEPFQGTWTAYQYGSRAWKIEIERQRFRGELGPDDWYVGQIRVRPDTEPAEIDFMIEDCRCSFRGMTSQAIFRVEGGSIRLAAPRPGAPRPELFSETDGSTVELKRRSAPRKVGDES